MNLTHPADGLYYLNQHVLYIMGACYSHSNRWLRQNPGLTPVTLENLTKHETEMEIEGYPSAVYWLIRRLERTGRFLPEEVHGLLRGNPTRFYRYSPKKKVELFMDLLLIRAKREGLIHARAGS